MQEGIPLVRKNLLSPEVILWLVTIAASAILVACGSVPTFTPMPVPTSTRTPVPTLTLTPTSAPSSAVPYKPTQIGAVAPTATPTYIPTFTLSPAPSQTPEHTPSPTPNPILAPSALKDVTVFYAHINYEHAAGDGTGKYKSTAELWRLNADGSGKQRLFAEKLSGDWNAVFRDLQLSHDSRKLVFIESVDKRGYMAAVTNSLWVVNIDGTDPLELVGGGDPHPRSSTWSEGYEGIFLIKERPVSPLWSYDDSTIAFVDSSSRPVQEPGRVCLLDVASGQWQELGEGEILDWSPDGRALVVVDSARLATSNDLRVLYLDGTTGPVVEWSSLPTLSSLDWSPLTGLVVAQTIVGTVLIIDPENGSVEVVIHDGRNLRGYRPQWSPSGKMISFARTVEGVKNLYVLEVDSRDERLVMPHIGSEGVWSPDNRLILVQSRVEGAGLYVVSVSDGQYWKIPNTDSEDEKAWWPSQTWLFSRQ